MSGKENLRELSETLEYINEESFLSDTPRGEVAMGLLSQENLNPQRKRVALIVRTQELIRQNHPRERSGS